MKAFSRGNKPFAAYERIVQNTNVSKITPFWDVSDALGLPKQSVFPSILFPSAEHASQQSIYQFDSHIIIANNTSFYHL